MAKLYLSKRNLLSLLSKVDRFSAGEETQCTITKYENRLDPFCHDLEGAMAIDVIAIPDATYYSAREAGEVHPADDPLKRDEQAEKALEFVREFVQYGFRIDTQPTRIFFSGQLDADARMAQHSEYAWWSDYVQEAERRLRASAQKILNLTKEEA